VVGAEVGGVRGGGSSRVHAGQRARANQSQANPRDRNYLVAERNRRAGNPAAVRHTYPDLVPLLGARSVVSGGAVYRWSSRNLALGSRLVTKIEKDFSDRFPA
jgi:hypothetical protein